MQSKCRQGLYPRQKRENQLSVSSRSYSVRFQSCAKTQKAKHPEESNGFEHVCHCKAWVARVLHKGQKGGEEGEKVVNPQQGFCSKVEWQNFPRGRRGIGRCRRQYSGRRISHSCTCGWSGSRESCMTRMTNLNWIHGTEYEGQSTMYDVRSAENGNDS